MNPITYIFPLADIFTGEQEMAVLDEEDYLSGVRDGAIPPIPWKGYVMQRD